MQKIGVFVCWCGSNIAATVDVAAVDEALKVQPGVVYATDYQYMCSASGQNIIKDAIKEYGLTGVVICSCSPRMHEATFRKTVQAAGLNPYMLEIANIREQCSWIHKDIKEATEKAIILGRSAIAKVQLNAPLTSQTSPVVKRALVIGGGIAGIQTALDIADAGFEVDIVEKKPTIGGKMSQLDKTFPTLDCAACILTPKMVDAGANDKIHLYTYCEVDKVSGFVGNFSVTIKQKPRYVDPVKCTGCGACTEKCPSKKTPNEFNMGLDNRPAIYIPFAQAVPKLAVIDRDACIHFKTGKCGLCVRTCGAGAINYDQKEEFITKEYGAIVVATGYNQIKPVKFDEYLYSQSKDVVTSLEFERIMNAAMLVKDHHPDIDVTVFYIDVRTPGKNFDEFYRRAVEQYGVHYIKGMVGKVEQGQGCLKVQASDLLNNEQIHMDADMVVLASAIEPDESARNLATMLTASMDTNDFFTEAHAKLRPVESPTAGIFLSGVCQGPKDIPETVAQASAAAAKVIGLLAKDSLLCNACVAHSDETLCNGCSQCANVCAYGAITYEERLVMDKGVRETRRVAVVNEAICQGCGACTVTCPSGAMDLKGFANNQIMAEVDAICK